MFGDSIERKFVLSKSKGNYGIMITCILLIFVSLLIIVFVLFAGNSTLMDKILEPYRISAEGHVEKFDDDPTRTKQNMAAKIGKISLDDILFLGDSRTVAMAEFGFVPKSQIMAEVGLNHISAMTQYFDNNGYSNTIQQEVSKRNPKVIIISFGVNGIAYMSKSQFMDGYQEFISMVQKASPDSEIILQAIMPVGRKQEQSDDRLNNQVIEDYNKQLRTLAQQKKIEFLDVSDCLKDKSGYLDERYDSGDGLHYNRAAYEEWFDQMLDDLGNVFSIY